MASDELAQFRTILKDQGYQITRAREAIFKLLLNAEPQTLTEIIKNSNGLVDRVSIYRNLELFERLGIAQRIYIGWKYKVELTDKFTSHHHHLICLKCDKLIDIEDHSYIDIFIENITKDVNFRPRRHQFEIDGYCSDCSS